MCCADKRWIIDAIRATCRGTLHIIASVNVDGDHMRSSFVFVFVMRRDVRDDGDDDDKNNEEGNDAAMNLTINCTTETTAPTTNSSSAGRGLMQTLSEHTKMNTW
jgi:hypothetical protein